MRIQPQMNADKIQPRMDPPPLRYGATGYEWTRN